MKSIVKSALILTAITLIAGICLAAVYQITKDPIAEAERAAAMAAYEDVFPACVITNDVPAGIPIAEPAPQNGVKIEDYKFAYEDGVFAGIALRVTSPNGYGGDVTVAVGVDTDGKLTGISVISQSETAGLGANCVKPEFTKQFAGIGETVVWTKSGKSAPNEIDAISGATVTTKAVTEAVNAALSFAQSLLKGGEAV